MNLPIVTIVGRPNVGKSTLFNRIIGRRQAIVDDQPGVTRDRNFAEGEWCGQAFLLADTGGYLPKSADVIDQAVREQVEIAIEESDVVVLVVDARTGITTIDDDMARILKTSKKEYVLVVNKVDSPKDEPDIGQFYKLGLGDPSPISAMIGRGTGDFLDVILEKISKIPIIDKEETGIRLAVIGKENVGKSSLVNTLLREERQIVTAVPGTTRDSIDARFRYKENEYLIIDTAGLKKRTKIKENILFYSNLRTYRSIQRCDVVIYMVDAVKGVTKQDVQIMLEAANQRKGLVCVINKWDLIEKDHRTMNELSKLVMERFGDLRYIPLIFTSVHEKQRLYKALDLATKVYEERNKRIPTSELNNYFEPIFAKTTPPATRGKEVKIKYVTQVTANPPVFVFYSNYPKLIADNYKQFIENRLREKFGFIGVPLTMSYRDKK
ncbi:MAG: ribosome biogenesis GTPase Der [Calditrichales bacterium]|nr:MAG: ribosome biogenesis GTPase Der [Calditrichales bacterium]